MTSEQDFTGEETRISYQALGKGVPVRASGGEEIGTVEHVLEVPELDVFDGIVLKTAGGLRFADADQVADITDRYVVLNLPAEETERLGRPQAPAVYRADTPTARCMTGSVACSAAPTGNGTASHSTPTGSDRCRHPGLTQGRAW
jgi:hypothetical protein